MQSKFKYIIPLLLLIATISACHKIDVTPTSLYTDAVYPETEEQYQSLVGPLYVSLRGHYPLTFWFTEELSTDEAILPAFGGNWYDGNKYHELHTHEWTKDNAWINTEWSDLTGLIGLCNQTLYLFKDMEDGDQKNISLAEIRTLRAYAYWEMMDNFGGVPLDTLYPSPGLQTQATRTQVFNYVESELEAAIPYLKANVDASTYGLVTRYFAYAILAKMYLNAEVYTSTDRYNDCITACDTIINSGHYAVQPLSTYLQMFYPTNGATTQTEFIFTIPFDASTSSGTNYPARYDLNRNLGMKYNYSGSTVGGWTDPVVNQSSGNGLVNSKPSGPRATLSSFLNYFLSDTNDIRLKQWLYGPQYWSDGNPIMVSTTKLGYNQYYTGSDGSNTYVYPLVIDTSIQLRQSVSLFDCGNDEIAWNMGARNIKFYPDATSTTRNQNNDAPLFRYSDILLMKAEAILRGGTATNGATALSLVNMVRSARTTATAWTSVTLEDLYEERCREFAWEGWHRNDMIRFGKFEDIYGFKTNTDTYRRIFPIPTIGFTTNSKLVQNTGY